MAGPAVVIVAGFVTAWLAIKSNDGLVEDNYYKVGLAVNQQLQQKKLAGELGLQAELSYDKSTNTIRILLTGIQASALPEFLQLKLIHPTRKGEDQTVEVKREGKSFLGQLLAIPSTGRWNVILDDPVAGWRMDTVWDMRADRHVMFTAKPQ